MIVNKETLVSEIATETGYTKKDIKIVLDSIFDNIIKDVSNNNTVNITGFGKFEKHKRAARTGVNPRTGEPITINAMDVPKFYAGAIFKQAVK